MLWPQDASMADEQVHLQGQLFHELKKRFPEVPDSVVASLMQKNDFVRERCIDALGRESNKYLNNGLNTQIRNLNMGGSPPESHLGSPSGRHPRVGSDSSESGGHHHPASSTAASTSSVPSHSEHSTNDMHYTTKTSFYLRPSNEGGGDAQNGPYPGFESPGMRQPSGASSGMWLPYPAMRLPQTSIYQPGAVSQGTGTHSPYPPQSLTSQPASLPPQATYVPPWPYEGNQRTPLRPPGPPQSFPQRFPPAPQGYRTPSPQQPYPYQFDPTHPLHYRGTSPGSPGGSGYPSHGPPPFNPGVAHPSAVTTTTSPNSSVSNLWYMPPVQASNQGSGSNCSTPTRSPFPVFSPSPWQQGRYPLDSEQLLHDVYSNQRRGSEDTSYTQALLQHQLARKEKLRHDLESCCITLENLRREILEMERETAERRNQRSSTFPTAEDVGKMREENRRLLIDIQLMTREVDMFNNGQALLGVLDPQEQQNFYKNIGCTGQRGSIHAGDGTDRLPIEEEGTAIRVPPARPPPPNFLPTSGTNPTRSGGPVAPAVVDPGPDPEEGEHWNCSACTFLNHPALDRCECCEMPRLNASNATAFS